MPFDIAAEVVVVLGVLIGSAAVCAAWRRGGRWDRPDDRDEDAPDDRADSIRSG